MTLLTYIRALCAQSAADTARSEFAEPPRTPVDSVTREEIERMFAQPLYGDLRN